MITAISNVNNCKTQRCFVDNSKNNKLENKFNQATQVSFAGNWTKLGKDFFDNESNTKNFAEKIMDHTMNFIQKIFGRDELPLSKRPIIAMTSMDPESHHVNNSISDGTETLAGKIEKSVATALGKEDEYDAKLIEKHNEEMNKGTENATRLDQLVQDSQNEVKSHETNPADLVFDQDGNVVYNPADDKPIEQSIDRQGSENSARLDQLVQDSDASNGEKVDLSKIVFGPDGEPILDENGIPIQEISEPPDDVAINTGDSSDAFGAFDDIGQDSDIPCDDF